MKSNAKSLTSKSTYGWSRLEVVGSMASLVFLSSLCFGTAIEAAQVSTYMNIYVSVQEDVSVHLQMNEYLLEHVSVQLQMNGRPQP